MRLRVLLLALATVLGAYGLLTHALETVWVVCVAAWLSSAVAFYDIAFTDRRDPA